MKKWIIIILVALLTVGTGLIVPLIINSEKGDPIISDIGGRNLSTQPSMSETANTPAYKLGEQSKTAEPKNDISTHEVKNTDKPGISTSTPGPITKPLQTQTASGGYYQEPTPVPTNVQEEPLNWVEARIQKYRDEIDDADLADFRRIYPRVDIGYVQGVGEGGYTEDELQEVKAYLRKTLGGDYERAKELFYKYSYLMSDD